MLAGRLLLGVATLVVALACGQPGADGITDESRPPMPSFAYSFVGCLNWSCVSGQCQNDPVVWGACCTYVSEDPEEQGLPRPSCGAPSYCEQYPSRCEEDHGPYPGTTAPYCFYANVGTRWDANYTSICSHIDWTDRLTDPRCQGTGVIADFPECFPTSGAN